MTSVYKDIKTLYNIDSPIITNIKESPPSDNFLLSLENDKLHPEHEKEFLEFLKFYKIDTEPKNIIKIKKFLYKNKIKS